MIDRTVSHYKILSKLGEGGMGTVFRGIDLMLDRPVAIKVLHARIARQPGVLERFRTEATLLARLNDPNIATLYSFFREGDEFFMVMELVNGRTLASLMQEGSVKTPGEVVSIVAQVLSALEHAHRLGILHRDIKPANILVTDEGAVKMTDFGIARALGSDRLTRDARVVGTLEYLAPERIRGDEGDERSDLYSVGAVCYELLTHRLPFERNSDFELMRAHLEEVPLPIRKAGLQIPPGLESVVLRALVKHPDHRFSTAAEMREALLSADLRPALVETRFVEPIGSVPETKFVDAVPPSSLNGVNTDSKRSRRSVVWMGLACAAVIALLLVVALTRREVGNHTPDSTAAEKTVPVTVENKPSRQPAAAVATTVPAAPDSPTAVPSDGSATDSSVTDEEAAEREKRATRAKRRAAAMQALDQ